MLKAALPEMVVQLFLFARKNIFEKISRFNNNFAIFSPRRVSEEVKRHSSRTLKTEYATLRFISVICEATSFLLP